MPLPLADAVCLVTGAASGIGRATALALAGEGAQVLAADRPGAGLDLEHDLALPGAAADLADAAAAVAGRVDVLVNCAGVGLHGGVETHAAGEVERLLAVNVTAPIELTRALLPGMLVRRRGHVVSVGSVVGYVGRPNEAVYAASKAALAIFTESLRAELRPHGVSASLVSPAVVETGFFEARGVPYGRRRPRAVSPDRVAAEIVSAIRDDRAEVLVPRWLALPVRLHGLAPRAFRLLATRFD